MVAAILAFSLVLIGSVLAVPGVPPMPETRFPPALFQLAKNAEQAVGQAVRAKRSYSNDDDDEDQSGRGAICAGQCVLDWARAVQRLAGNAQVNNAGEYDPDKLEEICRLYDVMKSCINACPFSLVQLTTMKTMAIMQFICHDSTYLQNAQCLADVNKEMNATCNGQCGRYTQRLNEYKLNPPRTTAGITDVTKQTCMGVKCVINCRKATVIRKCGQSAQNDMEGLGVQSMGLIKNIAESTGYGSLVSSECQSM